MPKGARVDGVDGLTKIEIKTLGSPSSLSVKGHRRDGVSHQGNTDAGPQAVWRRQDGILSAEGYVGARGASRQFDV
jgi:hypothetical protein